MLAYIRKVADAKNQSDEGASAVEYGLLIAAIAAVVVGIVFGIGVLVKNGFEKTCTELAAGQSATASQTADCK